MDLFTSRCGCGAIFKPSVRTQRVCAACTTRNAASARAATPAGKYTEPQRNPPAYQAAPYGTFQGRPLVVGKPQPFVNGALIPPDTTYMPCPTKWEYTVDDLRRGVECARKIKYGVRYDGYGRAYPTWFEPRVAGGTLQDISAAVEEDVRNQVAPMALQQMRRETMEEVVRIVERSLADNVPVGVHAAVVEFGPEQLGRAWHGFRVRARIFAGQSDTHELEWTFS